MRTLEEDEGSGGGGGDAEVVFRDMILLTLGALFVVVALMFPYLNPKAKQAEAAAGTPPPGSVMVELNWPDELDTDVDLWVKAPGDVPVGYSNKGGAVFNLLRDDLGHQLDLSGRNFEVAYARGIVPGEYVVNAHLYRNRSPAAVIPVTAVVTVQGGPDKPPRQILVSHAELVRENQEITIFRFRLDAQGVLDEGSVNSLFKPLRSGAKTTS